ncbi:MAG: hypothetical protein H7333_09085, partial [Bdellovibrionales bacterium]|nr:hypothetical protein [Oligoflexia bacterium]
MRFIAQLRELSGGKPIGFKLCVGKRREFFAICKAMIETGITPDFIIVDGGEGGTRAAPLEFSNSIGTSLNEGLVVVDKFKRVARFQKAPVKSFLEVMAAVGITHPDQISPWHIQRRISSLEVKHYGEIYDFLK